MSSFTRKTLRISVTLGQGTFSGGGNTKIIEGLATEVAITKPGLPEKNKATIKITGLKYDDMAQMTTLAFRPQKSLKNIVTVQAGVQGNVNLPVAFQGEITSAHADFNQAPDIPFTIEAQSGAYPSLIPSPQESVRGQATVASLVEKYAKEAGYGFKNEGVTASVYNAVLNGSPIEKARSVAAQVGCELIIDDGVMSILPAGGSRRGNAVLLRKDTGMIGHPVFTADGIVVKAIYNPDFKLGGIIKVESIVPRATGAWKISKLTHNLTAHTSKDGPWTSTMDATYLGDG